MTPQPMEHAAPDRHSFVWPALAAATLSLALYSVTLGGTFVYDDLYVTRDDPRLAHPSLWRFYWTDQYFLDGVDRLYRPLTSMTYAVQIRLHGHQAWPFHLVNWLLAAACAAIVGEFARRLAGWWPGLIAGLVFAAHPIHVEAVAGIVGRAELLCTLATVGGLTICLGRPLTPGRTATVTACFVVALLSKEQGIFFPLLLGLLAALLRSCRAGPSVDSTPVQCKSHTVRPDDRRQRKLRLILAMCLIYLVAGYFLFRERYLPMAWDRSLIEWGVNPMVQSVGMDRWLMPLVILGRYMQLLVWPRRLSIDYGADVLGSAVRWNEPWVYGGIGVALLALLLLVRAIRKRDAPIAFPLLAAGLLYGVVSNLPSLIGTILAERLMFLPSAFLATLVGVFAVRIATKNRLLCRVVVAGVGVLLVLGSVRTITYAARWNNPADLFAVGLAEQPRSVQLHRLVFQQYADRGQWAEARRVAESCRNVAPNFWRSYVLLATADIELGNIPQARETLQYAKDHHYSDELVGAWMALEGRIETLQGGPATKPASDGE